MTNCRIGRVTYKNTGQTLRVVPKVERSRVAQELITQVFYVLNNHKDPRAYALIVLDNNGRYSTSVDAEEFPFGYAAFVSLIKSLLERDVLTHAEVKHFCTQQGWI